MLTVLLVILFGHWLGDFVAQTRWMAENKSKNNLALFAHVGIYTAVLFGVLSLYKGYIGHLPTDGLFGFVALNAAAHITIDYFTSKLNAYFWTSQQQTFFWWSIGFDQYLHAAVLMASAFWLLF